MPIAYAMILVGGGGVTILNGPDIFFSQLKTLAYGQFSIYDLSVVPMFVLMGNISTKAGLSRALFRAASVWMGWMRGGVALAAIVACAGFGAVCGSSLATASTMGQVALPELKRFNYSGSLATGTLAAGGVLGILIPPSVVLVIYAIIVEANIVTMFAAALLPGIIAVILFLLTIAIYVRLVPNSGGGAALQVGEDQFGPALNRLFWCLGKAVAGHVDQSQRRNFVGPLATAVFGRHEEIKLLRAPRCVGRAGQTFLVGQGINQ